MQLRCLPSCSFARACATASCMPPVMDGIIQHSIVAVLPTCRQIHPSSFQLSLLPSPHLPTPPFSPTGWAGTHIEQAPSVRVALRREEVLRHIAEHSEAWYRAVSHNTTQCHMARAVRMTIHQQCSQHCVRKRTFEEASLRPSWASAAAASSNTFVAACIACAGKRQRRGIRHDGP